MTDNNLEQIAEDIGEITEEQEPESKGQKSTSKEGEDFDPEEFMVDVEEYDGGWGTEH